ncbi:MAG: excinuclease ABC subunit UvrC [Clostridia bacterium]|nr:excinuclease ABC subunit UvrC [Clostridia bacterium]
MNNIKEKLKNLPLLPGVYIMKSSDGEVIYVGKSKLLKNRVSQYFRNSGITGKVRAMVDNIADFEYIVTATETEALVLECNLIKKFKPFYNILLKDSKQYPYIKVSVQNEYPKISFVRKIANDGAKYYGPYTGGSARETIDVVRKVFKVPSCNRVFPRDIGKDRPCLNYHINNCSAPCSGKISKEEYREVFKNICEFLDGKTGEIERQLKTEMKLLSENLEFEKAAQVRDKLTSIAALKEKQNIIIPGGGDRDVVSAAFDGSNADLQVFNIRGGKLIGRKEVHISYLLSETPQEVFAKFLVQHYMDAEFIPAEILINTEPDDKEAILEFLEEKAEKKVELRIPQRGPGRDLIKMATDNAMRSLDERTGLFAKKEEENRPALEELSSAMGFSLPIRRIEAYDISNTAGHNSVGAMAVLLNGVPESSLYRFFKIKTVVGANDYASITEVIERRLRHGDDEGFGSLPGAIFVDGGLGHCSAAFAAMEAAGVHVPVFGMVKDNFHKTRALITPDGEIIELSDRAFSLVASLQEEVHRVAISYHRKLENKEMSRSALDEIAGIGPKKKRMLLRAFGSVKNIKNASVSDLAACGIGVKSAEIVYKYFNE